MHEQYWRMDRKTKLRDSITTLIASNFELVCMKSIFVEGFRIEKTGVRFHSKLRNRSVVRNDPNEFHDNNKLTNET